MTRIPDTPIDYIKLILDGVLTGGSEEERILQKTLDELTAKKPETMKPSEAAKLSEAVVARSVLKARVQLALTNGSLRCPPEAVGESECHGWNDGSRDPELKTCTVCWFEYFGV